jgi:hypothetical protein
VSGRCAHTLRGHQSRAKAHGYWLWLYCAPFGHGHAVGATRPPRAQAREIRTDPLRERSIPLVPPHYPRIPGVCTMLLH